MMFDLFFAEFQIGGTIGDEIQMHRRFFTGCQIDPLEIASGGKRRIDQFVNADCFETRAIGLCC